MQSRPYQEETGKLGVFAYSLCAALEGTVSGSVCVPRKNHFFVLCDFRELMNTKPCQFPELGVLSESHNNWCAQCVDKLLSGRNWRLGFTVGEFYYWSKPGG